MRLAEFSSGVPAVGGRGPAPTEAGRPIEAEDGDRELVGVRLLLGKLGGPGGAWRGEAEAECLSLSSMEIGGLSSEIEVGGASPKGPPGLKPLCCCINA